MCGPYGCSISTGGAILNELRPIPGSAIAIFGAGDVGLATIMAARLTDATQIIAVDKVAERLALALERGATHSIEHGADTVAELKELTGDRLDDSVEATDGSNLAGEAITALGPRGTCAMVGGGQTPDFLQSLMELQRQGRFPLEKLVRFYDFADVNRAVDDSDAGTTIQADPANAALMADLSLSDLDVDLDDHARSQWRRRWVPAVVLALIAISLAARLLG